MIGACAGPKRSVLIGCHAGTEDPPPKLNWPWRVMRRDSLIRVACASFTFTFTCARYSNTALQVCRFRKHASPLFQVHLPRATPSYATGSSRCPRDGHVGTCLLPSTFERLTYNFSTPYRHSRLPEHIVPTSSSYTRIVVQQILYTLAQKLPPDARHTQHPLNMKLSSTACLLAALSSASHVFADAGEAEPTRTLQEVPDLTTPDAGAVDLVDLYGNHLE